jgi:hypothetical protein
VSELPFWHADKVDVPGRDDGRCSNLGSPFTGSSFFRRAVAKCPANEEGRIRLRADSQGASQRVKL